MSISSSSSTDLAAQKQQRCDTGRYRIGDVTRLTGLSADTLRYYEKIKLLPRINRSASGIRVYTERDLSLLNFIRRAQKMNFSLAEIANLLKMRQNPQRARKSVRELTAMKLTEIEARLKDITILRDELQLLLNLCQASEKGCPIIESIDSTAPPETKGESTIGDNRRRR